MINLREPAISRTKVLIKNYAYSWFGVFSSAAQCYCCLIQGPDTYVTNENITIEFEVSVFHLSTKCQLLLDNNVLRYWHDCETPYNLQALLTRDGKYTFMIEVWNQLKAAHTHWTWNSIQGLQGIYANVCNHVSLKLPSVSFWSALLHFVRVQSDSHVVIVSVRVACSSNYEWLVANLGGYRKWWWGPNKSVLDSWPDWTWCLITRLTQQQYNTGLCSSELWSIWSSLWDKKSGMPIRWSGLDIMQEWHRIPCEYRTNNLAWHWL